MVRSLGDMVFAGTINVGSTLLRIQTTAAAADTTVACMAVLVEHAASQQSPAEALVAKVTGACLPADPGHGFSTASCDVRLPLNIATPCSV